MEQKYLSLTFWWLCFLFLICIEIILWSDNLTVKFCNTTLLVGNSIISNLTWERREGNTEHNSPMKVDLIKIFPSTNQNSKLSKFWRHQNAEICGVCVVLCVRLRCVCVVCQAEVCLCDWFDWIWLTCMLLQRGGGKSDGRQAGSQSRGSGGSAGCHGRPGELLLSPIEDVSPSVEAAEQESMSRIQVGRHRELSRPGGCRFVSKAKK